jgi:hypothetical protein
VSRAVTDLFSFLRSLGSWGYVVHLVTVCGGTVNLFHQPRAQWILETFTCVTLVILMTVKGALGLSPFHKWKFWDLPKLTPLGIGGV